MPKNILFSLHLAISPCSFIHMGRGTPDIWENSRLKTLLRSTVMIIIKKRRGWGRGRETGIGRMRRKMTTVTMKILLSRSRIGSKVSSGPSWCTGASPEPWATSAWCSSTRILRLLGDLFYLPSGALVHPLLVGCLPRSYQFNIN